MSFQHVENLFVDAVTPVAWQPPGMPPGLMIRMLGEDPESGMLTAVVDAPEGWQAPPLTPAVNLEVYMLDGALALGDVTLRPGFYSYRVAGDSLGALSAPAGCSAIVRFAATPAFSESETGEGRPLHADAVPCLDTWQEPWIDPLSASAPSEDFRAGVMVKMLRRDTETGATTHLAGLMPGWFMPGQELHPVIEENYCLSGDVHIADVDGEPGYTMQPGCYLARPPGVAHGPIVSKNGNVNLIFAHGPLGIDYVRHPDAEQMIRRHLQEFPWI